MEVNPVFLNELRQSYLRRKPVWFTLWWAVGTALLVWIALMIPPSDFPLTLTPLFFLPIIVPAFAAGVFAKEYEQRTWQDLYLTRLTNAQVVWGKFFAALLQVWFITFSFLPAIMVALTLEGKEWAFTPGWWVIELAFKMLLSISFYVVLAMVCSRYCSNRRAAMASAFIALFLYCLINTTIWRIVGEELERSARAEASASSSDYFNRGPQNNMDMISPGFMQGVHLIFCSVAGGGFLFLLWVSMSEQRGYRGTQGGDAKRAWQPVREAKRP